MFGFGSTTDVLNTREIEDCLSAMISESREGDELWLITPYATMAKLSSIKRGIAEATKRKADVRFVVRDDPGQVNPAKKDLGEALSSGLKLYCVKRLHAKVYWSTSFGCLITSANLLDSSFEASMEIGVFCRPGGLHDDVRDWIRKQLEPELQALEVRQPHVIRNPAFQTTSNTKSVPTPIKAQGHCLRCSTLIELNPNKPYCLEHYRSWASFNNPDFPEKFCHACGKSHVSTMAKPVCRECYRRVPSTF